ncbi:MAG: hypothetical protein U0136_08730 [Bdellovibrionota bacterium]
MIYAILIAIIFLGGFGGIFVWLGKKYSADDLQLQKNIDVLMAEKKTKEGILRDLAQVALGYVTKEYFEQIVEQHRSAEEELRAEKGRLTITEAELEAVDVRLRELEELKRELEMSSIDAIRELELLRAQERDIANQNETLKNQLKASLEQLDMLLDALQSSGEAVERLTNAKKELLDAEVKTQYYQENIAILNHRYVDLKKAYDALDIEYAQLYEKQQQG